MATLMRAKTANTKAKSVDKVQLAVDYVSAEINEAVRSGLFSIQTYLEETVREDVKTILFAAGYSVSVTPAYVEVPEPKLSFLDKFLRLIGLGPEIDFDSGWLPRHGAGVVTIDWSLVRELDSTK